MTTGSRAERRAPWGWADVLGILAGTVLLGVVFAAATATAVHSADASLDAPSRSAVESLAAQLVFAGVALSVTLLVLVLRHDIGVGELGWRRVSWRWMAAAIPLALLALLLAGALGGLAQSLMPHAGAQQCLTVPQQYGRAVPLAIPVACVAAPIADETLFRGVLYRWLRGVLPRASAMVISAGAFALFHFNPALFLPLAGLGVLLAWLYERTGSIWPGVAVHALFSLVGVIDVVTATRC